MSQGLAVPDTPAALDRRQCIVLCAMQRRGMLCALMAVRACHHCCDCACMHASNHAHLHHDDDDDDGDDDVDDDVDDDDDDDDDNGRR